MCVALSAAVLIVAASRHLATVTSRLKKDARDYAEATVTAITTRWDAQALKDRAGPLLIGASSEKTFAAAFDHYRELGALVKTNGCQMQSFSYNSSTDQPSKADARYQCSAEYQNGPAQLSLTLFKEDAGWRLNDFSINLPDE